MESIVDNISEKHVVPDSVPDSSHYSLTYVAGGRLFSFAHQAQSVYELKGESVLEVGVGVGYLAAGLRVLGHRVTTLDIQPDLNPDLIGSVTNIPMADDDVDVAVCCQVLEHLPFNDFSSALRELGRVSRRGVVVSLPDITPHFYINAKLPLLGAVKWKRSGHWRADSSEVQRRFDVAGHYWEIGYPETPLAVVKRVIEETGLKVERHWRVPEHLYHRFFVLKKDA